MPIYPDQAALFMGQRVSTLSRSRLAFAAGALAVEGKVRAAVQRRDDVRQPHVRRNPGRDDGYSNLSTQSPADALNTRHLQLGLAWARHVEHPQHCVHEQQQEHLDGHERREYESGIYGDGGKEPRGGSVSLVFDQRVQQNRKQHVWRTDLTVDVRYRESRQEPDDARRCGSNPRGRNVRVNSSCRQNSAPTMKISVTNVNAAADAPNIAIDRTKGENLMSANVSGPSEPAAG